MHILPSPTCEIENHPPVRVELQELYLTGYGSEKMIQVGVYINGDVNGCSGDIRAIVADGKGWNEKLPWLTLSLKQEIFDRLRQELPSHLKEILAKEGDPLYPLILAFRAFLKNLVDGLRMPHA